MCGIFGIYNKTPKKNMKNIIKYLKNLQHRGRDGYGIVTYDNEIFYENKYKGIINTETTLFDFTRKIKMGIAHTRYTTSTKNINGNIPGIQPLKKYIDSFLTYLVHNGNIINIKTHDTAYLFNLIHTYKGTFEEKLKYIIDSVPAAYCLIIIHNNSMYIIRDRFGIRPLCIGETKDNWFISSESCSIPHNSYLRDVMPGEIIKISENKLKTIYQHPHAQLSLCSFELYYFLSDNSFVDGYYVKNVRKYLGYLLAKKEKIQDKGYIVIGIPQTGISYGKEYAKYMKLKYQQLICKNTNIGRTFILPTQENRINECKKKFIYDKDKLKNQKIIIVDDSIVRGNVIKSIIDNLKKCQVKEIHIRIPSPPVIDICELGIAIKTKKELFAHNKSIQEMTKELNIDSLEYLHLHEIDFFPQNSYDQCFSSNIIDEIKKWKPIPISLSS